MGGFTKVKRPLPREILVRLTRAGYLLNNIFPAILHSLALRNNHKGFYRAKKLNK